MRLSSCSGVVSTRPLFSSLVGTRGRASGGFAFPTEGGISLFVIAQSAKGYRLSVLFFREPPMALPAHEYCLFAIGEDDECFYEYPASADSKTLHRYKQLIAHAALDVIDDACTSSSLIYFRDVDAFQNVHVSAYVPVGPVKFILLQERQPDERVLVMFRALHDLIVKYVANPFSSLSSSFETLPSFKERARVICQRHLE